MSADIQAVDLYAGAGGLSLGFERAGAKVVLAVEANAAAAATYRSNHPDTQMVERRLGPNWNLAKRMGDLFPDARCDLLIGGPPCQGWSSLGGRGSEKRRAQLNSCVEHFLAHACRLRPPAVVMENVRGLAVKDGGKHLRRVEVRLRESGYAVTTLDVRAADFGVPQLRHRIFVVATRLDLQIDYQVAPSHDESTVLTVWDAISDLPSLKAGTRSAEYLRTETEFQREMRGDVDQLTWHEAPAHSDRILEILRALPSEGASRSELTSEITLTSGFHNTYCRLWAGKPAPAVTSSAGRVSSGRNAHPYDDRALTPREAARLQSFPDSYKWKGDRWPVYQQIGNAVPPKLAEAIARPLVSRLRSALFGER